MIRSTNLATMLWSRVSLLCLGCFICVSSYANTSFEFAAAMPPSPCDALELEVTIDSVSCPGAADGSITVEILNAGEIPEDVTVEIFWTGPGLNGEVAGDILSGIGGGTYTLFIDLIGPFGSGINCTRNESIVVAEGPAIELEVIREKSACDGLEDGLLEVAANGGTGTITYAWDTGASGPVLTGLVAGAYTVTATDGSGCTARGTYQVGFGSNPSIDGATIQDVTCFNGNDGMIDPNESNDVIAYSWSTGVSQSTLSDLDPGTYSLTVENSDGCIAEDDFVVGNADPINVSLVATEPIPCEDEGMGTITAAVDGGVEPYSFTWSNGNPSEESVAMYGQAGNYTVLVVDAEGCPAASPAPAQLGFADPPELINFSESVSFSANVPQQLRLEANNLEASFNCTLVSLENIVHIASDYEEEGTTYVFFNFTLVLEQGATLGSITIEVITIAGSCAGEKQTIEIMVRLDGCPIRVAEIFTPNADNVNDEWQIEVDPALADSYSISIFSRGGQLVFQSNDLFDRWTGDGCPDGSYFYLIEGREDGNICEGIVSLLR